MIKPKIVVALAAVVFAAAASAPNFAYAATGGKSGGYGGGHGSAQNGGHYSGNYGGHGYYGGRGYYGGHGYYGGYYGTRVGIYVGPGFGPWYYPSPFYYNPYFYGAAVIAPAAPTNYIEQGVAPGVAQLSPPQEGNYWFYCSDPQGYYPYVQQCRGAWQRVSPTPPGQ